MAVTISYCIFTSLNNTPKNKTTKAMTTQEFKTIAASKLNKLSTADLIAELKKLANDFSDGAELVYDVAMDILMNRLPENEFIELCNSL